MRLALIALIAATIACASTPTTKAVTNDTVAGLVCTASDATGITAIFETSGLTTSQKFAKAIETYGLQIFVCVTSAHAVSAATPAVAK